ncbi:helix-turn-helix transcriptional regulator [Arthrobacter echini]|uniref:Helix-turn-helix transcriptional regulator n=1 Tax=Arthrobacter echini TaxID=1529066 RepID=A0A4S5DZZ2_9MICC|nr:helix-turn-helix transcriptional regulator [Arthrobacter echini]THJ64604.1 helix-turn-helix transcriptional regulator [Arthrobacter echini]
MQNLVCESRQALAWSQQRLADELGVSRQTIISIERGRFDPSLPLAFRLAATFGTTLEELFFPEQDASSSDASVPPSTSPQSQP